MISTVDNLQSGEFGMANRTRLSFFSESVESSLGKLSLSVWHYLAHNSEDTVTVLYCTVLYCITVLDAGTD